MMDAHDRWFAEQVLPLEAALTNYFRRAWPNAADVEDLRQEVYVRVYEAGREKRPAATNYFVFAVARNLLTDKLRRQRVVTIDLVADLETLHVLSDEVPADRALSGRQELARLQRALTELPPRCREIFCMRKVEGLSQRETAARLGISQSTIEKQVGKAMRFLATSFFGNGSDVDVEDRISGQQDVSHDETGSPGRN
jgi:RNA polymerase sigma factor (sigma-70 family)